MSNDVANIQIPKLILLGIKDIKLNRESIGNLSIIIFVKCRSNTPCCASDLRKQFDLVFDTLPDSLHFWPTRQIAKVFSINKAKPSTLLSLDLPYSMEIYKQPTDPQWTPHPKFL